MDRVLFITSSLFGEDSVSRQIAGEFVSALRRVQPGVTVTTRDLDPATMPHLSRDILGPSSATGPQGADAAQDPTAFADRLIEEVEAADIIVIAAPMYNFSISSTLKAWIDHIARAGRTFRYTAAGPEGLLKGKRVVVVTSRGGFYSGAAVARDYDFQEPYLRAVLGFLGLDDVTFIHAEGLKVSPEEASRGLERARRAIGELLATADAA